MKRAHKATASTPWWRGPRVRGAAQIALVLVLLGVVVAVDRMGVERKRDAETTDAIAAILADACGAASTAELREQGLLAECRLARAGDLPEALPPTLPEPEEGAPDIPDAEPDVRAAVEDYFADNPIPDPDYQRSIARAVENYLTRNPTRTRPSLDRVRRAVRTVLFANPPADGTDGEPGDRGQDGADGRGVATASLDGCMVVFTYSDGSTDEVGPLCGPQGDPGPAPTEEQIVAAVAAYCADDECRGPTGVVTVQDDCDPQGRVVTDVGLTYDPETRTVRLTCETAGLL